MPENVEILNNKALLKLNKRFYSLNALKQTIDAFKEVCDAELSEKERFEIMLKPREKMDLKELALEFSNYALGMMK